MRDAAACSRDGRIGVDALQALGAARAKNLLRWLVRTHGLAVPGSAELDEMLRQIRGARPDAALRFELGGAELRRYRGTLWLAPPGPAVSPQGDWIWRGERIWRLPELGGVLRFGAVRGRGLRAAAARAGHVTLRRRTGGETMRIRAGGPRRTVKKLLQEHGMPPWERESLPLVYCNGELACLPGVAVAATWQAGPREAGLLLEWEPEPARGETGRIQRNAC